MATYYVSKIDGSDSYNGTAPAYVSGTTGPWLTLAKSVSTVSSGDTVYLRAGTWSEALNISGKAYGSTTTWARYPSDGVGTAILDGTGIDLDPYEEGVVWIHSSSSNVLIDGLKVIDASHTGIAVLSSTNIDIRNCISDYSLHSGIAFWSVEDSTVYGNTIYDSNMPAGSEEVISICSSSTNIEVSYNTLYAGNRTLGATGGEGLNIKDGCSYIYVHHNTVDMARPDETESDRYCMGVDGWTSETHHIYFYDNIVKNGSWGVQFNSEEGGYTHHIYAWNNIISHIGYGNMTGGGIGMPSYGGSPGKCDYCYWWNNTIYDCNYGAYFNKTNIGAPIEAKNNIFYDIGSTVIAYGGGVNQGLITCSHNLLDTGDPEFLDEGGLDFHLTSGSTNCIDQGATLSFPVGDNDDYDGVARPQGAAYDIGAYEYEDSGVSITSTPDAVITETEIVDPTIIALLMGGLNKYGVTLKLK